MPRLIVTGKEFRDVFDMDALVVHVGRLAENDVVIPLPFISGRWCRLEKEGVDYRFTHLARTNPTFLNGREVRTARLRHGDVLKIGSATSPALSVEYANDDEVTR